MTKILQHPYAVLLICLLVASCNLGLINRRLALQSSAGENMLGLRDFLLFLVVLFGLLDRHARAVIDNNLARLVLAMLFLTPLAALVGLFFGATLFGALRESVVMSTWILALLLGRYLQDLQRLAWMAKVVIALGVVTSVGVYGEFLSAGRLHLVTSNTEALEATARPTPGGALMMLAACSCLTVLVLRGFRCSRIRTPLNIAMLGLVVSACLLTQSRTLLVAILLSTTTYLGLCAVFAYSRTRWSYVVILGAIASQILPIVLFVGSLQGATSFREHFIQRYSVLTSMDSAYEHLEEREGRTTELREIFLTRATKSPIVGCGLASPYGDDSLIVHSSFGFFLLRYGVNGLLLYCLMIVLVLASLVHFARSTSDVSILGQAFSLAMFSIIVCSVFSNTFGMPYPAPQSMTVLGCLIAGQQLEKRCAFQDGVGSRLVARHFPRVAQKATGA